MKRIFFFFLSFLFINITNGQFILKYGKDGKLASIKEDKKTPLQVITPDEAAQRKEALDLLKNKCAKVAQLLAIDSKIYPFYKEIWDDAATITAMQQELLTLSKGTTAPGSFTIYKPLANQLPVLDGKIYEISPATPVTSVTISYNNVVNQMLLAYYNDIISDAGNHQVKQLALSDYIRMSDYITKTFMNNTSTLSLARRSKTETNRLQLTGLPAFRDEQAYKDIKQLLNTPWFKEWLWYTGGTVQLNPFELTGEGFFEKYPEFDVPKANIYNEYIDTLLRRHIRYDSTERLDEVKKLLAARQTGFKEFQYRDRIEKIKKENATALQALTTVKTVLNETSFPTENDKKIASHLYFSVDKKLEGNYQAKAETEVIAVNETKTIVIHNVPRDAEIHVRESTTPFKDLSQFRQFTDELSASATSLLPGLKEAAAVVTEGLAGLQSTSQPVRDRQHDMTDSINMDFIRHLLEDALAERRASQGEIRVIAYLKTKDIYNQDTFEEIKSDDVFQHLLTRIRSENSPEFNAAVQQYTVLYMKYYQEALDKAALDSMILYHVNNAIVNSTIPADQLKPAPEAAALYTSVVEKTSVYDDPVVNEVKIVAQKDKDSSTIHTFKYKMGKRYRFQLMGGLAYSFPSPVVNEVKETEAGLTVDQKKEQVKVVAGINFYLAKGLFLQDNRISARPDRWSLFLGVGVASPLKNLYTGVSWDIVPSVKLVFGAHFHNTAEYELKNDQIAKLNNTYKPYYFMGIGIDPVSFISTINLFK